MNLQYCAGDNHRSLEIYEAHPSRPASLPTAVYVHGGGWVLGTDQVLAGTLIAGVEQYLVDRGWAFVSVNYRLAPHSPWPAQVVDVKCAVRFLRQYATVLHLDPKRIGAIGESAGGQLVALLGLAGPAAGFDDGPYADQSSAVEAVVDLYGPADLTTPDWSKSDLSPKVGLMTFGANLGTHAPQLVNASPVTYVRPGAPPFLVMQGLEDTTVLPDQSTELVQRLHAEHDSATLVTVSNAGHGFVPASTGPTVPSAAQIQLEVCRYLVRHIQS